MASNLIICDVKKIRYIIYKYKFEYLVVSLSLYIPTTETRRKKYLPTQIRRKRFLKNLLFIVYDIMRLERISNIFETFVKRSSKRLFFETSTHFGPYFYNAIFTDKHRILHFLWLTREQCLVQILDENQTDSIRS